MGNPFKSILLVAAASAVLLLTGCSDSGNGGNGSGGYTGVTVSATISQSNATELAGTAIDAAENSEAATDASSMVDDLGGIAGKGVVATNEQGHGSVAFKAASKVKSLAMAQWTSHKSQLLIGAEPVTLNDIAGDCGGTMDATITDSSITIEFHNFDDCVDVTNGRISLEITAETSTTQELRLSFNNFRIISTEETVTIDGRVIFSSVGYTDSYGYFVPTEDTMEFDNVVIESSLTGRETLDATFTVNYETGTVSMSAVYTDADGLTYKVEDFTVESDIYGDPTSISGRVYHPEEGYVDITTPTAFTFSASCENPVTGVIQLDGANGYVTADAGTGNCSTYDVCWRYTDENTQAIVEDCEYGLIW